MSMFIVQSGLIRRSLVAFSTATVAEEEEDKDIVTSVLRVCDETEDLLRLSAENQKLR